MYPRLRRVNSLPVERIWQKGFHGESRTVHWKGREWVLPVGTEDWLAYYKDADAPNLLYILGSHRFGYVSLTVLDSNREDHAKESDFEALEAHEDVSTIYLVGDEWTVFFQDPDDIYTGVFGEDRQKTFTDYSDLWQCKILAYYWNEATA